MRGYFIGVTWLLWLTAWFVCALAFITSRTHVAGLIAWVERVGKGGLRRIRSGTRGGHLLCAATFLFLGFVVVPLLLLFIAPPLAAALVIGRLRKP